MTRRQLLAGLGALPVARGGAGPVLTAEVRTVNGTPLLFVNGKPHNPLIYFAGPHRIKSVKDGGGASAITAAEWPSVREKTVKTFEVAAKSGVHLHSCSVWFPWPKPGEEPDYTDAETTMRTVLERDPIGMVLLRFSLDPPLWWRERHPGELMMWDTGEEVTDQLRGGRSSGRTASDYPGLDTEVSVASQLWRKEAAEHLAGFVRHMEARFGGNILGYHPCGQNTHEWFLMESHSPKLNCCEPAFLNSWRGYLRTKYGTPEALRAAWHDTGADFESVSTPTRQERLSASEGCFRNPAREQKLVDFHEYQSAADVEALEIFARAVKANSRKLVVFFYGYLFELARQPHGSQQSGHLALRRLLQCPDVDMLCGPLSYFDRQAGGVGAFMTVVDSIALHGKLWCTEDDVRTHLASNRQANRPPLASPEETRAVHQRQFSHMLPRRMTCWYMDLHGDGWLLDDGIWRDLAKLRAIYDQAIGKPVTFHPEIAIIADEKSNYHLTQKPAPITGDLMYNMRRSLYRIGAPCGYFLLDDLAAGRIPKKKLYIFLNCFAMTPAERKAIAEQCRGSVCLFFYGNGFIAATADARNMQALLGAPIEHSRDAVSGLIRTASGAFENVTGFGTKDELSPVFYADPKQVEVLGTYANGRPGFWKSKGAYTTYYAGALSAPPELLRAIAKAAGVHIYSSGNDVLDGDSEFLAIHASSPGEKRLQLPAPANVIDAETGRPVGKAITNWTVRMETGQTRMFFLVKGA